MINIQVPDTSPEVVLGDRLRRELTVFEFDIDRYREGLSLAGVPDEAAETAKVLFRSADSKFLFITTGHTADYDRENNQTIVSVSEFSASQEPQELEKRHKTLAYALAASAKRMADMVNCTPDTIAYLRASNEIERRDRRANRFLRPLPVVGAAGGALVATIFPEVDPFDAVALGTMIGGTGWLVGVLERPMNRSDLKKTRKEAADVLENRAITFAAEQTKPGGAFADIVHVEFNGTIQKANTEQAAEAADLAGGLLIQRPPVGIEG